MVCSRDCRGRPVAPARRSAGFRGIAGQTERPAEMPHRTDAATVGTDVAVFGDQPHRSRCHAHQFRCDPVAPSRRRHRCFLRHRPRARRVLRAGRFDLVIAADEPQIEEAARSLREMGVEVDAVQADLATQEGVDKLYAGDRRAARRCAARQRRPRPRPGLSRPGFEGGAPRHRHQRRRHARSGAPRRPATCASARRWPDSLHRLDRRADARHLPGRLQRHQGVRRLVFLRAAQRAEGHRHHGDRA